MPVEEEPACPVKGCGGTLVRFKWPDENRSGRLIRTWKCHRLNHFFEEDITDARLHRALTPIAPLPPARM